MLSQPEVWKTVPSAPGLSASSWGRVRIDPYEQRMPKGGSKSVVGIPRYGSWEADGGRFLFVFKRKTYKVHQLVCEAFNGPKPFPSAVVMHDDEDGSHNWPGNLIWGTQRENMNYPVFKRQAGIRLRGYALARMQVSSTV